MNYIKIVRVERNNKYYSCIVNREGMEVEYIPNKFVQSNSEQNGLLVYGVEKLNDLASEVRVYFEPHRSFQVWLCEIENVMELPKTRLNTKFLDSDCGFDHVDLSTLTEWYDIGLEWPEHTVMVKNVKLVKRLGWKDFS